MNGNDLVEHIEKCEACQKRQERKKIISLNER